MKRKNIFILVLTMVFTLCLGISMANRTDAKDNYKILKTKNITSREEIKIPFDYKIAADSVAKGSVYILDNNSKRVSIKVNLDQSGKTIIVKPVSSYVEGGSYTLYVTKDIKYSNGKYPEAVIKMKFEILKSQELPKVGTIENLKKILSGYAEFRQDDAVNGTAKAAVAKASAASPSVAIEAKSTADGASSVNTVSPSDDYSKTNVQVNGVDEADIVKSDGEFIYTVNNQNVFITKAVPASDMKVVSKISFEDKNFTPTEMYADKNYLVVLGMSYSIPRLEHINNEISPYMQVQTSRAIVYDITNKASVSVLRTVDIEGNYISSRKIGTKLYLIANRYAYYNPSPDFNLTPMYRDSIISNEYKSVKCDNIRYFPDSIEASFMMVGVMDITDKSPMTLSTYLGSGQNIYMSSDNLYISISKYSPKEEKNVKPTADVKVSVIRLGIRPGIWWPGDMNVDTLVYKFAVTDNGIAFVQKGEVPGTILNQYSMDENGDFFRIATTKGNVFGTGENISKNNLYILDKNMKVTGKLEDMAPGEKIYSVRFMGERAYVVTYKKVDPLFVIDLKDERNPKILGALKIPGYSDYLHPYDENHIIGFGKDSVEIPYKDGNGNVAGTNAYYLGMKLAIFDVTDVAHPKEMFKEAIGDRGTYSELLYNPKALLFSREKGLLAFPITVFKLKEGQDSIRTENGYSFPEYGTFDFQGAYVYNIDLNKGFSLKGRITHLTDADYQKSGMYEGDWNKYINRIIYIGDNLYTMSNNMLKATGINDMKDKGSVETK